MRAEDRLLRRLFGEIAPSAALLVGPGDDAAVVAGRPGPWVVTTDALVEGVDFLAGEEPGAIGRRAFSVNASDLAAMGARPELFLLTIAFPAARGEEYPLAIARGALSGAAPFAAALAGGDLSDAPATFVSVALWGRPEGEPMRRSGARPGDAVFLSGFPGRAAAGLRLAREETAARSDSGSAELLAAYRDPSPRVGLGLELARRHLASAAIDVSDGLGIDASRLAEASGVRIVLEADRLPVSPALAEFAGLRGLDPRELALAGGDDYELLFTVPAARAAEIPAADGEGTPVTRIGSIESGRGAVCRDREGDRDVSALGYDHLEARA